MLFYIWNECWIMFLNGDKTPLPKNLNKKSFIFFKRHHTYLDVIIIPEIENECLFTIENRNFCRNSKRSRSNSLNENFKENFFIRAPRQLGRVTTNLVFPKKVSKSKKKKKVIEMPLHSLPHWCTMFSFIFYSVINFIHYNFNCILSWTCWLYLVIHSMSVEVVKTFVIVMWGWCFSAIDLERNVSQKTSGFVNIKARTVWV